MQSGHAEYSQGYHQAPYGYTTQALSVASNSGHDINKPVAATQQGMYSNAGMPAPAQHHQSMGGPIASPQPIIQQGQQISRNPITMQAAAYFPRNSVPPRSMQNMARNPIGAVVNQAGQQPSSQYGPMPTMVPIQPNFTSFPPTMVNPQYPQMFQQRAYNPTQYPIMASQQYVWNYNTPPPQNSNGYFPSHTMSSYQSMPPQIPPQTIPAQPQPQHSRKGEKAIPIIDPKTGKNVLSVDKSAEDTSSRPNSEKDSENSDSNICVQFATQVAAVLNDTRNDVPAKQPEPVRLDTMCSPKNEGIRVQETPVEELVDENITELQSLSEVEFTESRNLICSEEISGPYYRNDLDSNSINESESIATKSIDSEIKTEDREQNVFEASIELSIPDADETVKTEKHNSASNSEKVVGFSENKKINAKSVIESDYSNSSHEPVQPVAAGIKEELVLSSNNELLESPTAVSTKITDKGLNEGKKNKTKKKKDLNKRGESKEGGEMDAFLDTKEGAAVSPVPPPAPATTAAPTSVPTPVSERIPSPVPIMDSEILNSIPLPGENPDPIPQIDISPSEPSSETSSVSPSADSEDKENSADPNQKKGLLKYSYKEDQWSPLNPEGKKQYDRDFLLQLQGQPMSLCKPNNLPNLDVIKDKAHIQKLTEVNRAPPPVVNNPMRTYDPFMPGYARAGPMPRMPHAPVNRRSQGRGGEKPRKVISFTNSLNNQNIKLHESQNAWKPLHKSDMQQDEKDRLKRSVQGVLNKLTPQKFETLLAKLKGLNIDTEEKLALVIDLIFEKAIDEPNFSVPYANLCKHLALVKVPVSGTSGNQVNFRKLLLTKCQKEFEQDRSDELKNEEKMKLLEAADADKRKELQLEYDEEEKKIRYRQLGNIRFIGELFKLGMLIEPIMHECIKKLLSQGDEESLECLCKLLKTIGKELDDTKPSKNNRDNQMDMYFGQMKLFVDKRLTSSRVRFMLQDVIDLKKNNWVPRRDENNPKTIDQIHKEAEREAREQQQVYQNMTNYPKRMPDDRDRRKNTGRMGPSEDGWTPSSKSSKGSYSMVDPSKLKLTKPDEVESIRLGPGGSGRGLTSWGRGSSGGTKTAAESEKTALTNRFSALSEQSLSTNYEGRRGSQRSAASSRESSRGRNSQLPPAIRKTPSTSKERENLLETVKGLARTSEAKTPEVKATADVQVNGKAAVTEELALNGPDYSEEDMEKKSKPLIEEFLHNNDLEEAIKCVTELASPNTIHLFINATINQVLERSSQARYSLGQLLASLLKKKIMTFDQYKKGFADVLEIIDDYALDIPLIWDYMGEILEPMIEDIETPFRLLKEVLQPCIPSEKAGLLVSSILHCAAKRRGHIKLGEVWRESGVQWTDIIGTDSNVPEFIEKHKLEFTVSPAKVNPQPQMSMEEIKNNILSLLEKNAETELVFDWVDANVSDTSGPTFVRALVTAVHESCLTGSGTTWELQTTKLKSRIPLISRYVSSTEKLQLQALYAVQALMNQLGQPSGLLHQIFDVLYDDDVISDESFKEWEQSDDPNEAEGKGVAVHSVKSFFTWLREPEEETEEMNSV